MCDEIIYVSAVLITLVQFSREIIRCAEMFNAHLTIAIFKSAVELLQAYAPAISHCNITNATKAIPKRGAKLYSRMLLNENK